MLSDFADTSSGRKARARHHTLMSTGTQHYRIWVQNVHVVRNRTPPKIPLPYVKPETQGGGGIEIVTVFTTGYSSGRLPASWEKRIITEGTGEMTCVSKHLKQFCDDSTNKRIWKHYAWKIISFPLNSSQRWQIRIIYVREYKYSKTILNASKPEHSKWQG